MPINDEVQLAVPLDPIYAIEEYRRSRPIIRKPHSESFNRWRAALPRYCFEDCPKFGKCTPNTKCPRNPKCR